MLNVNCRKIKRNVNFSKLCLCLFFFLQIWTFFSRERKCLLKSDLAFCSRTEIKGRGIISGPKTCRERWEFHNIFFCFFFFITIIPVVPRLMNPNAPTNLRRRNASNRRRKVWRKRRPSYQRLSLRMTVTRCMLFKSDCMRFSLESIINALC